MNNKRYEVCNVCDSPDIFKGYFGDYEIDSAILKRLSKELGFPYDLYVTLSAIDTEATDVLVKSMSRQSKHEEVLFLLDDELMEVVDYTVETDRNPVLNSEFVSTVKRLAETCQDVQVAEVYHLKDDKVSSIILKRSTPIVIEEKHKTRESDFVDYTVGILLSNDETGTTSSRLVLYSPNGQPMYLPASLYSTSTTRYKRSTSSSIEALEVLTLKVIDDMRGEYLQSKIYDLHFKYRYNKNIIATYEEYNELLRIMRKVPTIIEDNSYLSTLLSVYEDFEKRYVHLEDQKSSYIWRCTALGDITIDRLINTVCDILEKVSAPPIEYTDIRDRLGSYISTSRIADDIAKDSSI